MLNITKNGAHTQYGLYEYVADEAADIASAPTNAAPGSKLFCIEDSSTYIFTPQGEWALYTEAGGGGGGDVTKAYLQQNYYDKAFFNSKDTLVIKEGGEEISFVEEKDISYSAIPLYCGKWVDGSDIHRRVYVVTSGIARGNTIKVADKPANMKFLVRGFGIVECAEAATEHTMTNSDISVYVKNSGVFAVNNFTGYAEKLYIVLEYTVEGGSV